MTTIYLEQYNFLASPVQSRSWFREGKSFIFIFFCLELRQKTSAYASLLALISDSFSTKPCLMPQSASKYPDFCGNIPSIKKQRKLNSIAMWHCIIYNWNCTVILHTTKE